ncbi:MAG: hypothetical protein M1821_006219 [Bathelium mastoideum]|nr:MAG: hypothetical protein M1821_006219 [Bathelium mastoideum]
MEKPAPRSRSHSRKPSRRSTTNLNHLTLAPLTTAQPLLDDDSTNTSYPRTSYIEDRSAPTTPSILSRSGSRKQLAPNSSRNLKSLGHGGYGDSKFAGPDVLASHGIYAYAGNQLGPAILGRNAVLPKAKSSTALLPLTHSSSTTATAALIGPDGQPLRRRHHQRSRTGGSLRRATDDDSWLLRVGTVLAASTRDAKGQSWLVSRQSSTSLVADHANNPLSSDDEAPAAVASTLGYRHSARGSRAQLERGDELGVPTPRYSRHASRNASRVPSRGQSRQGSWVELLRTPTAAGARTPVRGLGAAAEGYFGDVEIGDQGEAEADFVDLREEEEEERQDEDEVARLTRERNSGLGGWVDRLIGFSLFNVDEDREESADETAVEEDSEGAKERRIAELKRREEEKQRLLVASQQAAQGQTAVQVERPREEQGGWQDAAWLLSVASKVLI